MARERSAKKFGNTKNKDRSGVENGKIVKYSQGEARRQRRNQKNTTAGDGENAATTDRDEESDDTETASVASLVEAKSEPQGDIADRITSGKKVAKEKEASRKVLVKYPRRVSHRTVGFQFVYKYIRYLATPGIIIIRPVVEYLLQSLNERIWHGQMVPPQREYWFNRALQAERQHRAASRHLNIEDRSAAPRPAGTAVHQQSAYRHEWTGVYAGSSLLRASNTPGRSFAADRSTQSHRPHHLQRSRPGNLQNSAFEKLQTWRLEQRNPYSRAPGAAFRQSGLSAPQAVNLRPWQFAYGSRSPPARLYSSGPFSSLHYRPPPPPSVQNPAQELRHETEREYLAPTAHQEQQQLAKQQQWPHQQELSQPQEQDQQPKPTLDSIKRDIENAFATLEAQGMCITRYNGHIDASGAVVVELFGCETIGNVDNQTARLVWINSGGEWQDHVLDVQDAGPLQAGNTMTYMSADATAGPMAAGVQDEYSYMSFTYEGDDNQITEADITGDRYTSPYPDSIVMKDATPLPDDNQIAEADITRDRYTSPYPDSVVMKDATPLPDDGPEEDESSSPIKQLLLHATIAEGQGKVYDLEAQYEKASGTNLGLLVGWMRFPGANGEPRGHWAEIMRDNAKADGGDGDDDDGDGDGDSEDDDGEGENGGEGDGDGNDEDGEDGDGEGDDGDDA